MVVTFDIYFLDAWKTERLIRYKLEPDMFIHRWQGVRGGWMATPPLMTINSGRWSQHHGSLFLCDTEWFLWWRTDGDKMVAVLDDFPDKVEVGNRGPGLLHYWGAPKTFPSEEFTWEVASIKWSDSL